MESISLIGKKISYHDGFSGSTETFTITSVKFDGRGYEVRGDREWDFLHFTTPETKELIKTGKTERNQIIDHCHCKETYTIQG